VVSLNIKKPVLLVVTVVDDWTPMEDKRVLITVLRDQLDLMASLFRSCVAKMFMVLFIIEAFSCRTSDKT